MSQSNQLWNKWLQFFSGRSVCINILSTFLELKEFMSFASVSLSRPEPPYTKTPGVVLTFGQGDVGQLGLGADTLERSRPAVVPCVDHVIDVCAGGMHTVCLTESGEVRHLPVT